MTIKEQFEQAVGKSKELTERPANDDLLKLYALYKQSTDGDISTERPGGFDFKGAAKFDAWDNEKGKPADAAMLDYIDLVNILFDQEA